MKLNSCLKKIFTLLPVCLSVMAAVFTGCSDDGDEFRQSPYGYVQFKVYKSSAAADRGTRSGGTIERLDNARKIKVLLLYKGKDIEQTVMLNRYSSENAEFGLRSDKLKLLCGDYQLIGYYLYDKLDNEIYAGTPGDSRFTIISGGVEVQDLFADATERGMLGFKLVKSGLPTRAADGYDDYPFSNIRCVDITVKNLFTQELTTVEKVKVDIVENLKDSYATCDTTVWIKAGNYQISSYATYSDKDGKKILERATVRGTETFTVTDNEKSEATVPISLSETAEYLKDYMALKAIWEALDGKNWSYDGETYSKGCNWNFDKEIDMWGDQPGVELYSDGRVASLIISGFGAKGRVPDAIGQLTELRILNLGDHNEFVGGHLFDNNPVASMTEEKKKQIRTDYEKKFLYHDVRENLSEILINGINANPQFRPVKKSNRLTLKDVQFGNLANGITGISKALMRCTNLENFFIANAPIKETDFCTRLDEESDYSEEYRKEEDEWSWENLTMLTDMEIYNCPKLSSLPMNVLTALPELQMLNVACNKSIDGQTLLKNWEDFIDGKSGDKLQLLYIGYNNLTEMPAHDKLKKMIKMGMLDITDNKLTKANAFGKEINLVKVYLDNNEIEEIESVDDENGIGYYCGYYDMELFSCSNNRLTEFPDIFNANSAYIIGEVSFAKNLIEGMQNGENHRGVNTSNLDLSTNRLKKFPKQLIEKGSPLSILILRGNGMESIDKDDLVGKNSYLLQSLDLTYNNLKEIPFEDFLPENLPYLYGVDFSYNQFAEFPVAPLNCNSLVVFGIRHQRDDDGNRCLREWPTGLYTCPRLSAFYIGSNDLRKIDDTISPNIRLFEIKDNPNISIDLSTVCPYIRAGLYTLVYDKTQNIKGCDILLD